MTRKKKASMRARYPQARGRKPAKASDSTERVRRHRAKMRAKGYRMKVTWVKAPPKYGQPKKYSKKIRGSF